MKVGVGAGEGHEMRCDDGTRAVLRDGAGVEPRGGVGPFGAPEGDGIDALDATPMAEEWSPA